MATFKQKPQEENPFRPGPGEVPPLLAGRAREQDKIGIRIRGLSKGGSTRPFAIYGPRGMGKTVLLHWVQKEYGGKGKGKAAVIQVEAAAALASQDSLYGTFFPKWRKASQTEVGIKGGLGDYLPGATFKRTTVAPGALMVRLAAKLVPVCKKRPIVLLLDEAHALGGIDKLLYQQFLNVAQSIGGQAPFLLALTGTPDLPDALSSLGAGFIDRAEDLGLGLLEQSEAERAIRVPLAEDGIDINDDALAFAVDEAQRYPYFLQSWGRALWDAAMTQGKPQLSLQDAEGAREEPQGDKAQHYAQRYKEVVQDHLTAAAAQAVADAFKDVQQIHLARLRRVVKEALSVHLPQENLSSAVNEQYRALQDLGFIWSRPGELLVRPGIPSLMDYTRAQHEQEESEAP